MAVATYAPSVLAAHAEHYTYDELEQLTKVTKDNKTVASYTYDTAGNILTAQNATGTHTYTYGNADWRDLLTAYDGHNFDYEQLPDGPSGNPTTYYNGTEYDMTWKMGNQLAEIDEGAMTFSYDADGIRTSKTVASGGETVTYNYLTQDGKVMRQEWDKDDVNYQLDFFYDTQGKPLAVIYRQGGEGLSYYYLTNQQGDVTKLYKPVAVTTNGKTTVNMVEIATYSYDPWGKATVTVNTGSQITNNDRTLANINPLRYRGYYQDVETGFYYLQSRYYDPVIGQFINADLPEYAALSATDITGTNLFAYCKNDPINHADEDGEWLHLAIGAVVGAAVGVIGQLASDIVTSTLTGKKSFSNWQTYVGAAVGGAAGGVVFAATKNSKAADFVSGAVSTGVGQSLEKLTIRDYDKSWAEIGRNTLVEGATSLALGNSKGIKGVTAGRNSWSAVYKSGLTKLKRRTASRMSAKVMVKGLCANIVSGRYSFYLSTARRLRRR